MVERILGPLGRRVDELSPIADGRLADGSRVNVVIPPLAIDGVTVSIRRFAGLRPGPQELVEPRFGPGGADGDAPRRRRGPLATCLISGGTGSGKTTLLNALSSFISPAERVITIEDAAELRLRQPHVVRLESRPPGIEGTGAVTIRDLVRNALRMRPDRTHHRRGPWRRGDGPDRRPQHGPPRRTLDRPRQLARPTPCGGWRCWR